MNHEVSNVRAHCLSSLRAVGHPALGPWLEQMAAPATIRDRRAAEAWFGFLRVDTAALRCSSLEAARRVLGDQQDQAGASHDVRVMALVAACCLLPATLPGKHRRASQFATRTRGSGRGRLRPHGLALPQDREAHGGSRDCARRDIAPQVLQRLGSDASRTERCPDVHEGPELHQHVHEVGVRPLASDI